MTEFKLSYTAKEVNERLGRIDNFAEKSEVPKKTSDLVNDSDFSTKDYVQGYAQPLGDYALRDEIPTDYLTEIPEEYVTESELNAKGYLTEHQNIDGLATKIYVDEQIAAIQIPDVDAHNTATDSHNDIRLLVEDLTTRLNTLANSDDVTLDQMSEVVAYIKNNKSLIDGITTSKINVSDIINNLTTNVTNKPLSAAQGVALKALIDAIVVPTKVSQLTNDSNYLTSIPSEYITETELNSKGYLTSYTETDPTVPAWAKASTKPSYTKSEVGLGNVDNVKQYSADNPPPYPVTSVNGKTGAAIVSEVPSCSASNNGQFLRVVNGAAAWSTVPNAEEASF